jgi:hypothetical protein
MQVLYTYFVLPRVSGPQSVCTMPLIRIREAEASAEYESSLMKGNLDTMQSYYFAIVSTEKAGTICLIIVTSTRQVCTKQS